MIKLIVGLGNPGEQYHKTRHNAGFWFLDDFANNDFRLENKFQVLYSQKLFANQKIHLAKPITFMNASGRSVAAIANFYQIAPNEILVVHDELDLDEGIAKLKLSGGHGGHNGLRDIIKALGTPDFYRLRIGISHPGNRNEVINYVLKAPNLEGMNKINDAINNSLRAIEILLNDGAEKAMNFLHNK